MKGGKRQFAANAKKSDYLSESGRWSFEIYFTYRLRMPTFRT